MSTWQRDHPTPPHKDLSVTVTGGGKEVEHKKSERRGGRGRGGGWVTKADRRTARNREAAPRTVSLEAALCSQNTRFILGGRGKKGD